MWNVKCKIFNYETLWKNSRIIFPNIESITFGYYGIESFMDNFVPGLDRFKIFWKYPRTMEAVGIKSIRDYPIMSKGLIIFVSDQNVKVLQTQSAKIINYKKECFKYWNGYLIGDGTIKITKAKDITEEYKLDSELTTLISNL